jgi:acyl-CoA thioester hydrolase
LSEEFRYRIRVRFHECDPQGHVFNANYLTYFDVAMTELWRQVGGYEAMLDGDGIDMVVAEVRVRYLAPLGFDEEADLVVSSISLGTTSMTTRLAIERDGQPIAEGEVRHVFVNTREPGTAPIPDRVRAGLERYSD